MIVSDFFDFEASCILCDSDDVDFFIVDEKTIKLVCNSCGCVDYIELEE